MTEITRRTAITMLQESKSMYIGYIPLRSRENTEAKLIEWRDSVSKSIDMTDIELDYHDISARSVKRVSGYRVQFDDECWLDLADKGCSTSTYIYREFIVVECVHYDEFDNVLRAKYLLYALV